MKTHSITVLLMLAGISFLSGCATGPSPEELRAQEQLRAKEAVKQLELQKLQTDIKSGNFKSELASESIVQIEDAINDINIVIKRNSSDASLSFDKATSLLTFSKGDWSWETPVTKIRTFAVLRTGSYTCSYADSTGRALTNTSYGPAEGLILSVDQAKTIYEKSAGKESWVDRTSINKLTDSDFEEVERLFRKITEITGVSNPLK